MTNYISDDEVQRTIDDSLGKRPPQAVLGDGNVPANLYDPDIPGNVWIQEQGSNGLFVKASVRGPADSSIPLVAGTPVFIGKDEEGQRYVKSRSMSAVRASGMNAMAQRSQASNPGVTQGDIATFRCIPSDPASTVVSVKACLFISAGIIYQFVGASIDLGPSGENLIPSAGNMARIIVALKSDFVNLEATSSTPRSMTDVPLSVADTQEAYDALTAGSLPSWYIDLYDAQSTISATDVTPDGDMRNMINLP